MELPLFDHKKSLVSKEPLLILKKVILGFKFSEQERNQIKKTMEDIFEGNYKLHFPFLPEILITDLKEKYFSK